MDHTDQIANVRDVARAHALDHYLSALLAPSSVRDDLVTLAAFFGETSRIAQTVSEPMLGEIRLQWWRDALHPDASPSGHPVADALRGVIARHGLDRATLDLFLDARAAELQRLPFGDEGAFDTYLMHTDGALFRLSGRVLGSADTDDTVYDLAAQSYGRARVALTLPLLAAQSRLPLWSGALGTGDELGAARNAIDVLAQASRSARSQLIDLLGRKSRGPIDAILPVALLEPYFRALQDPQRDPLRDLCDLAPLSRVSRLAWARLRGKI